MNDQAKKYRFDFINNHPLIEIDGRTYVIDTGSSISFFIDGHSGILTINNSSFELPDNPLHIDREGIEDLISHDINGFIGLDVLTAMGSLYLNRRLNIAEFNQVSNYRLPNRIDIARKSLMGLSFIEAKITINGIPTKAIIDSGAYISYASSQLLASNHFVGSVYDYSPSFGGEIETEKYEVELSVAGQDKPAIIAKMTPMIEMSVGILGYKAILGFGEIEWEEMALDVNNQLLEFA